MIYFANMTLIKAIREQLNSPRNSAVFTTINLLLGTGPIIIPQPFFRSGFLFSTIWTLFIFLLSYNSANYIGQSIQLINRHKKSNRLVKPQTDTQRSLIQGENQDTTGTTSEEPKTINSFDHVQQFRYLFGERSKYFPVMAVSIYLFGVSISKCIMTGKTLSKLCSDITVLNQFQFWLSVFFISGAAFSFKSIDKTKVVQAIIISVRFISILLMVIGAFVIMGQNNGIQNLSPNGGNAFFNPIFFGDIFSNLIFSFLFHHSMPGITKQLTEMSQIKSFLKWSFAIAGATMILIPITASMAFGNDLIDRRTMLGESHTLIYYNEDFKDRIDFIYYFVSFYVFLNVAAFSVYIIVIRRNILSIVRPAMDSDNISKTTVIISAIILLAVLAISFALKNYIQYALNFTGGIFGCIILFFIPSLQVYKARKLFPDMKSFMNVHIWMPFALMALGTASIIFNLYQTISNLVN